MVPATSFCEYDDRHAKRPTWFALAEDRPPFAFAGVWRPWNGTRGTKAAPVEGEHLLYAFLTTDANAEGAPVHPKAMPVLLRTADEIDRWLTAPTEDALELQRPLPDGTLEIVAVGQRQDVRLRPPSDKPGALGGLIAVSSRPCTRRRTVARESCIRPLSS